ncbi:PREDICTED: uncharacterized protein LOC104798865 [Tarenaya hassleriana]|uniref:uncharacterized protein LOC104798865 n=1 Tax=Tarenaya hassleriana TaxID=28532 RepID=UPI00053C0A54|nr:PREDICTED: uncharacterized protein LOC104798865 [Tarenaya hassleriana]
MSCYRRIKPFLINSRRNIINPPRISPESPSFNAFSRIHRKGSSNLSAKFSGFKISSRRLGLSLCNSLGNTNVNACNRFLSVPKKFDCVDRYQVHRFKPSEPRRWSQNPAAVLAAVLVGSGVLVTVYCKDLETVPYTKRRHFVLWPKSIGKWIGECEFQLIKFWSKGKILPADHPESIRVKSIVKDIIEGLQRSLSLESVRYASMDGTSTKNDGAVKDTAMGLSGNCGKGTMGGMKLSEEEELVDDTWIQQSSKKGKENGSRPTIAHLEGLNWEALVVKGKGKAYCSSSGKIVVYTDLVEHLKTDAEIATAIGHEIGSFVARHTAEETSTWFWFWTPLMVLSMFITMPFLLAIDIMVLCLVHYLMSLGRKNTKEADHIGLILQAAAGYDPRLAPGVYEKLGTLERARMLAQSNAMEEALSFYCGQVQSDRLDLERVGM